MIEIIGKNGSGKSYIANELYRQGYQRNVGYTTRKMRFGEVDGIDYHFISENEFTKLITENALVDYKMRNGCYYGIARNNLTPKTVLVSGDRRKIMEETGLPILSIYIDADLVTRYHRMLSRKLSNQEIFARLHTENFAYLDDFESIFVDNNSSSDIISPILDIIDGNSDAKVISNQEFLQSKQKSLFGCSDPNLLLKLLKYEEYIMRKFYLEHKDLEDSKTKEEYTALMASYARFIGIDSHIVNDDLSVFLKTGEYQFDYKVRRRVKK